MRAAFPAWRDSDKCRLRKPGKPSELRETAAHTFTHKVRRVHSVPSNTHTCLSPPFISFVSRRRFEPNELRHHVPNQTHVRRFNSSNVPPFNYRRPSIRRTLFQTSRKALIGSLFLRRKWFQELIYDSP